jgi:hypothetical protein
VGKPWCAGLFRRTSRPAARRCPCPAARSSRHPVREDYEYERRGTATLFPWYEPLQSHRHVAVTAHRTRDDRAHRIKDLVDVHYPDAEKIVLIIETMRQEIAAWERDLNRRELVIHHGRRQDQAEATLSIAAAVTDLSWRGAAVPTRRSEGSRAPGNTSAPGVHGHGAGSTPGAGRGA